MLDEIKSFFKNPLSYVGMKAMKAGEKFLMNNTFTEPAPLKSAIVDLDDNKGNKLPSGHLSAKTDISVLAEVKANAKRFEVEIFLSIFIIIII